MMEGGGYGGCGKQLRNCLSLSVDISHYCISLSLSFCSHSRSDPRLAWGNVRLDDFTTSTGTAVS